MSRFNTGNPLGSNDPRDLDDNAKNMDLAVNSDELSWRDRLGRDRKSFEGMEREFSADQSRREQEFDADQIARDNAFDADQIARENAFESAQNSREVRFNEFIASSGYQFAGDYGPGIEITEYNQLIRDSSGEFWRVSGQVELPYTTTGAGIPEDDALVPAGDAVLRQDIHKGMTIEGSWAVDGSAMREPLSSSAGISLGSEKARPMVTFIDDDGRSVLLTKLRPLYDAKGVKPGISIPTGKIGQSPYMTWEDVRDLYDNGWEIMSHTVTERNLSSVPPEEWEQELRDSRWAVETRGMKIESFVPPFGAVPASAYPLIRKYYRSSYVTREDGVQPIPINNYRVHRKNAVQPAAADNPSLQELKDSVDLAIARNSWLVLTTHANYDGLDEAQIGVISDLIDYIRSMGVDIVTPSEGLNVHGNLIDTGIDIDNLNPDAFFKIDRNGEAWPLKTKFAAGAADGLNLDSQLTDFEDNCITVLRMSSGVGTSLPAYLGARRFGVLRTVKHFVGNIAVGHQEFFPTAPGSQCFIRVWSTSGGWQPWVETSTMTFGTRSGIDGNSPITDFTPNNKTVIRTSSGDGGWPTSGIFTVETTHNYISSSESYGYQTAINRANGLTYIRSWDRASSQWFGWQGIGGSSGTPGSLGYFDADTPLSDYPTGQSTQTVLVGTTGMPASAVVGVVTTSRHVVAGSEIGYQMHVATDANRAFIRTWARSTSTWREWVETTITAL